MSVFNSVPITKPKRNLFNLSFSNRFSCKLGQLVPILCKPVVPGDTFKVSTEIFIRTAPLVSPMFQEMKVYVHFFYVPNRLIMDKWEQFISPHATLQEPNPTELILPHINMQPGKDTSRDDLLPDRLFATGELLDFLGYNPTDHVKKVSLLPVNAYNLVYQQYYRDQNLGKASTIDDPVILNEARYYPVDWTDEGTNYTNLTGEPFENYFKLRQKAWKKDYFTSALPFTQRGADVRIPLYGNGDISTKDDGTWDIASNTQVVLPTSSPDNGSYFLGLKNEGIGNPINAQKYTYSGSLSFDGTPKEALLQIDNYLTNTSGPHGTTESPSLSNIAKHLTLDLEQVNAATINEFRRALALQKYFETSARVGGRYKEFVLGHFGVNVPDGRLQRAEYLGGGMQVLNIGEVVQTSSTISTEQNTYPLGQMAGRGIAYGNQNKFRHTFVEHGYVLGIMSIQPDAAYYQGLQKDLQKLDRLDFYTPEFAQIGEQPIAVSELYLKGLTESEMDETFGYTPRYAEYKFSLNEIHGEFKTSLDTWHMARKFDAKPTLSKEFIEINEYEDGLNRVFAVQGSAEKPIEHFYCFVKNNIKALRPMPVYGVPSL